VRREAPLPREKGAKENPRDEQMIKKEMIVFRAE
jgi:hypothetical protein